MVRCLSAKASRFLYAGQEVHGRFRVRVVLKEGQRLCHTVSDSHEHGVVFLLQGIHGHTGVPSDLHAAPEDASELFEGTDFFIHHGSGEPVFRDAIAQVSAGLFLFFENRHAVSCLKKPGCRLKSRGTASYDGHPAAVGFPGP